LIDDPIDDFRDDFLKYITTYGFTSYINRELILEDIVQKTDKKDKIVEIMKSFLDEIKIDKDLIIIDPYLFSETKDNSYVDFLMLILSDYLSRLEKIILITNAKVDEQLKNIIEDRIKKINQEIDIQHFKSDDWHDRFWISNTSEKGILTGTSLNGLGKRYAIIDRLAEVDVKAIIKILKIKKIIDNPENCVKSANQNFNP
jgi:hypothetical protein